MRERRGNGPRRVGESMPRLLGRLGASTTPATMEAVFTRWEELVGAELGEHLRPVRVDGRALVVAVDHPAWATQVRRMGDQLLDRVAEETGADRPARVEVRVQR